MYHTFFQKNPQGHQIKPKANVSVDIPQSKIVPTSCDQVTTVSGSDQSASITSTPLKGGGSLLEGTYNEEESAASFQQALAEWRTGAENNKTGTTSYKGE